MRHSASVVPGAPGLLLGLGGTFAKGVRAFRGGWWLLPLTAVAVPSRVPPAGGLKRLGRRNVTVRLRQSGYNIQVRLDEMWGCVEVFAHAVYDSPQIDWEHVHSVLDIGANNGTAALWFASRAPAAHVLALEPCADTAARATANIQHNGLQDRVVVMVGAVVGAHGPVRVIPGANSRLTRTGSPTGAGAELVQGWTFDEALHLAGGAVDVVKIDCEGAEYEIFAGASEAALKSCSMIVGEYHPASKSTQADLFERLRDAAFRVSVTPDSCVAGLEQGTFVACRDDRAESLLHG